MGRDGDEQYHTSMRWESGGVGCAGLGAAKGVGRWGIRINGPAQPGTALVTVRLPGADSG